MFATPKPSKELQRFLEAWDLDDALHAATKLRNLSEEQRGVVRHILLTKWSEDKQAVANLLQNPWIIPEDIRADMLLKGLQDLDNPYNILSAAVGCQEQQFPDDKREQVKQLLISIVDDYIGPIANRAWTTLSTMLKFPDDVSVAANNIDHPDKTLRRNARSWLVQKYEKKSEQELEAALRARTEPASEYAISATLELYRKHRELINSGKFSFLGGGLAYIPNLNEFARHEAYREYLNGLFGQLDEDEDGYIGAKELMAFFQDLGAKKTLEECQKMIMDANADRKDALDVGDWFELMDGRLHVPDDVLAEFGDLSLGGADLPRDLQADGEDAMFDLFDCDKDGKINAQDLKEAMLSMMGQKVSDEEAAGMIKAADLDGDGVLNKEEFKKFLATL